MDAFPEGNTALATDSKARSLKKWNSLLVQQHGAIGSVPFPEGTTPLPTDSEKRSRQKINAIYAATSTLPDFPSTGLTAYWKLDEASGERADSSGNGYALSENGGAIAATTGKLNNGASFDGSTVQWLGRADPDLVASGDVLTISCWVKLNSLAATYGLVGKYSGGGSEDGYLLFYDTGVNRFIFRQANSTGPNTDQIVHTQVVETDTWYHIVCGWDGLNHFMSINGGTRELDEGLASTDTSHDFQIGVDYIGQVLDGVIDEVGLWLGTVLTEQQATDLYNNGSPLPYS